jgi:hypothetical protein
MKPFSAISVLCCALVSLTACKDFSGSLETNERISLIEQRSQVEIQPGRYSATLRVQSKSKVNLEVELPGGKSTFTFKTNQNLKKLNPGDRIQMSASESGQPYDASGIYDVRHDSTSPQRSVESCSYTTSEYSCWIVTEPRRCQDVTECGRTATGEQICKTRNVCTGGNSRQECGNRLVTHYGHQEVEYYYSTQTEGISMQLSSGGRVVAILNASDSKSDKIYTHRGACY